MSFQDGWSAIHLEMPPRIPHTEYSVESHWELVKLVTGINIGPHSLPDEQMRASFAFMKAWNFDFRWNTYVDGNIFNKLKTDMGHAEYAAGGVDRRDTIYCPFTTPEEVLNSISTTPTGPLTRSNGKPSSRLITTITAIKPLTWLT